MRTYDVNFKLDAVALAEKIGTSKTAKELNIPDATLSTWVKNNKNGTFSYAL